MLIPFPKPRVLPCITTCFGTQQSGFEFWALSAGFKQLNWCPGILLSVRLCNLFFITKIKNAFDISEVHSAGNSSIFFFPKLERAVGNAGSLSGALRMQPWQGWGRKHAVLTRLCCLKALLWSLFFNLPLQIQFYWCFWKRLLQLVCPFLIALWFHLKSSDLPWHTLKKYFFFFFF